MRSGKPGQPSQATPTPTPSSASLTASLVKNMSVSRPFSAAPRATRNATVTFSGSSSPVVKLMTALPAMTIPLFVTSGEEDGMGGERGRRPGFPLQIERLESVQQPVLHREQRRGRAGGCAGLG